MLPGVGLVQIQVMGTHTEPVQNSKQFTVVLYITNDTAGAAMAFICAVVIRGTSKPLVVELTSRMDEEFGGAPVVLIPIFWADEWDDIIREIPTSNMPDLNNFGRDFIE